MQLFCPSRKISIFTYTYAQAIAPRAYKNSIFLGLSPIYLPQLLQKYEMHSLTSIPANFRPQIT